MRDADTGGPTITRMSGMPVYLRDAREDAAACIDLRGRTRENAFSAEQLAQLGITVDSWAAGIAQGDSIGRVAWEGERMAGYCFADRDSGEVLVLALLPDYEGRGIGRQLLQEVVSLTRDAATGGCSWPARPTRVRARMASTAWAGARPAGSMRLATRSLSWSDPTVAGHRLPPMWQHRETSDAALHQKRTGSGSPVDDARRCFFTPFPCPTRILTPSLRQRSRPHEEIWQGSSRPARAAVAGRRAVPVLAADPALGARRQQRQARRCCAGRRRHHEHHPGHLPAGTAAGLEHPVYERLDGVAGESSDGWNNAGTGHSAFAELNYTPELPDGSIETKRAVGIAESFEVSRQFWSHQVKEGRLSQPSDFINPPAHELRLGR
jgi:GNAT superfamily N-acetyltransferase